jgi:hypothetical protein
VERAVHRDIPIAPLRIADAMPKDDLEYFLLLSHWMDCRRSTSPRVSCAGACAERSESGAARR